jgi:hypothetical protein
MVKNINVFGDSHTHSDEPQHKANLPNRTYYCSVKFKKIKIDLENRVTYNCDAAMPHQVDFEWLEENPGQLFNTPINVAEREQMLQNIRNKSCEQNCWRAEDRDAISYRMERKGEDKTHTNSISSPEAVDLVLGTDCNLTCSYCCKEFSSAWRRDVLNNGNYELTNKVDDRYDANIKDKIHNALSQQNRKNSKHYQLLLNEAKLLLKLPTVKKLFIAGGEPLIMNHLIPVLESLETRPDIVIEIDTGLGVSESRLKSILPKLEKFENLFIKISSENIGGLLEFNRYGVSWEQFKKNVTLLENSSINIAFHCTISNLSIFGFEDFYKHYKHHSIDWTFVEQPLMMSPYILDETSKGNLVRSLSSLPKQFYNEVIVAMKKEPSEQDRISCKQFLSQFSKRRNLKLDVFPNSFVEWLQLDI